MSMESTGTFETQMVCMLALLDIATGDIFYCFKLNKMKFLHLEVFYSYPCY